MSRTNVFISYSHKDAIWLKRLQIHLKPLERDGLLTVWDDTKIRPGSNWRYEIKKSLNAAKVAVLLVSADFLASEFIYANELPPLLNAAESDGVLILPIIVGPCLFTLTKKLQEFQAFNPPEKPLIKLKKADRERIFTELANRIYDVLPKKANNISENSNSNLLVRKILERHSPNSSSHVFDIIIENPSEQQLLLIEFDVRWQYHRGMLCSIDRGMPLNPVAEYVIKLPISPEYSSFTKKEPLDPVIAVPPCNISGSSLTTLRLQLYYYFTGSIDWHPCCDWDIFFSLSVRDDLGGLLPVFSHASWRTEFTPLHCNFHGNVI